MENKSNQIKNLVGKEFRNIFELDNALMSLNCWSIFDDVTLDDLLDAKNGVWSCKDNGGDYIISFSIPTKLQKAFDDYYLKDKIEYWQFMEILENSKILVVDVSEY